MNRPSWEDYFLDMLPKVAARSTCLRHKLGAIITVDNQIVTTGYNGAPKGLKHCDELGGCLRDKENIPSGTQQERCRAVHAEENAILQAAVRGLSIAGGVLYTTMQPCVMCARKIINAGILAVYYQVEYPDKAGIKMLNEATIPVIFVPREG